MANVLFIHGINVREPDLQRTMEVIKQKVSSVSPASQVLACAWGDDLGARLGCSGRSIPDYDTAKDGESVLPEMQSRYLWQTLYEDPFFELRLLVGGARTADGPVLSPGALQGLDEWTERLQALGRDPKITSRLQDASLSAYLGPAVETISRSDDFSDALAEVTDAASILPLVVARCLVALMLRSAAEAGYPSIQGAVRDDLVRVVQERLGGAAMGVFSWLSRPLVGLAQHFSTQYLKRHRGGLSDLSCPAIGDVLHYQGRGELIRERIAEHLQAAAQPLVVVAHSLGGVALVDTLLLDPSLCNKIAHLYTVGSQAGFFFEIDALVGRPFANGASLPSDFPPWTNFYDRADMLSYLAAPIFERVKDIEVASEQPFPQSHSAYWTAAAIWEEMGPSIRS